MPAHPPEHLPYQRGRFMTQLPADYRYTLAHYWIAGQEDGLWRVGFTRFATRLLGELVEYGFNVRPKDAVRSGQILGWIEGFKSVSDVLCLAEGAFVEANPALQDQITLINTDPYGAGWLYAVEGKPDPGSVDVHGYVKILDATIDKLLEKQTPRPGV
jgi:glycine cleavage system H protein